MERFLEGRVAWVTGGASGMGRAMALAFAKAGAHVAIGSLLSEAGRGVEGEVSYLPGGEELEATRAEIVTQGVRGFARGLDVTSDGSVEDFHGALREELGEVDILANAAGITAEQTLCGHPDGLWERVIDVNLHGSYRTIRRCLPPMIERRWGRVINIASTAASVGAPTSAAYCASKAGLIHLTKSLCLEYGRYGIRCNAVSPGVVATAAIAGAVSDEENAEMWRSIPLERAGTPDDIAQAVLFFASELSAYVSGQMLLVDGGVSSRFPLGLPDPEPGESGA